MYFVWFFDFCFDFETTIILYTFLWRERKGSIKEKRNIENWNVFSFFWFDLNFNRIVFGCDVIMVSEKKNLKLNFHHHHHPHHHRNDCKKRILFFSGYGFFFVRSLFSHFKFFIEIFNFSIFFSSNFPLCSPVIHCHYTHTHCIYSHCFFNWIPFFSLSFYLNISSSGI